MHMIPNIIHYFWLGDKELPKEAQEYIDGWRQLMPEVELRYWNNDNIPKHLVYVNYALAHGEYANAVDFLRLYVLYQYGGVYLDTDVEMVRSFAPLLQKKFFIGRQSEQDGSISVNNAVIGSHANEPFLLDCMLHHLAYFTGVETANFSGPLLVTSRLKYAKLKGLGGDLTILPERYFYPFGWHESFTPDCVTPETYAIHHWSKSWIKEQKQRPDSRLKAQLKRVKRMSDYLIVGRKNMERLAIITPVMQLALNLGTEQLLVDETIPAAQLVRKTWQSFTGESYSGHKLHLKPLTNSTIGLESFDPNTDMVCLQTGPKTDFEALGKLNNDQRWINFNYAHVPHHGIDEAIDEFQLSIYVPIVWLYPTST